MISERHEELATLYTLGLLERAERNAFESELAGNVELRSLEASLAETTAALALSARPIVPPATLKARVLSAASAETSPGLPPSASLINFPRWLPLAAAAGLAVATVWLGTQNLSLREQNAALHTKRELAELAYQAAQSQLRERTLIAESMINDLGRQLREQQDLTRLKVTALASLAGNSPTAQAIAVWDPGRETGLLTIDRLPAIADSQDYQIWVVDPAYPIPVDGGVFKPGADGRAVLTFHGDKPIKSVAAFAISLEKKGGVPKAEGPIVLLGKL